MPNAFVINGHEPYEFSKGELNKALTQMAIDHLKANGYDTRTVAMTDEWDPEKEIENHQWADLVILQTPVNWMGVTWSFKKYMDTVYSFAMDGRLCAGDGRTRENPTANYGSGGTLQGTKYMLSLTFNAPEQAFNNPNEYLFQGKSVDDLFFPMHMNFRFFAMEALPTFVCYDVLKNPQIQTDFERFKAHLAQHIPAADTVSA